MNNAVLSENTAVGEAVWTLEASDPEKGPVHFGISGTDLLTVDRDTGLVRVAKPLDREVQYCSKLDYPRFYTRSMP